VTHRSRTGRAFHDRSSPVSSYRLSNLGMQPTAFGRG
jgi:hypothetical protein